MEPAQAALGPMGVRGLADALANIILFLPLGLAAALALRGRFTPVLLGAGLSLAIELAQLVVPGRYPSLWDIGYNAAGAALGGLLAGLAPVLLRPGPRLRLGLGAGSLTAALVVLIGGAALFAPAGVRPPLRAEWTPITRAGDVYAGRVTTARLGSEQLLAGTMRSTEPPMVRVRRGDTLAVTFIAGPEPAVWVPVLRISDDDAHHALTVAVRGRDVAFSFRTRAAALHLDQPDIRLPQALEGVRPGQEVRVTASGDARGHCLRVDRRAACTRPSVGDTWALLLYPVPRPLAAALPYLWVALLLVPVGFWAPGRRGLAVAGVVAVGALLASSRIIPAPHPNLPLLLAAAAGLAIGYAAARLRQTVA